MKKLLTIIIILLAVALYAQQTKKYTVLYTLEEAQNALNVAEQSNAPHQQVEAFKRLIISQISEQMKADSLKAIKP